MFTYVKNHDRRFMESWRFLGDVNECRHLKSIETTGPSSATAESFH